MHWSEASLFYHIYPLGFCGAPPENDGETEPEERIKAVYDWIGSMEELGVTALYLGPLFESATHGYDTIDYRTVDRRLGTNGDLSELIAALQGRGIRVVLDAVLNHVSRRFFAFQDVLEHGDVSRYWDWFAGISLGVNSPLGDPFSYETWDGHYELVKLNHENPEVREYLLGVVEGWITEFGIDGLRLDAADVISEEFLRDLRERCGSLNSEFWLLGEMVHGDYNRLANSRTLHSVTNYECYKGLYSSHNDGNYFEIAHSLKRQFQDPGIYRDFLPYNFADNHDVDRVATSLDARSDLYPLHILLCTMPGIPSIYYGSEWGIEGGRGAESDDALRPPAAELLRRPERDDTLYALISRLARIRRDHRSLQDGRYRELLVEHRQLAFLMDNGHERMLVAVNSSDEEVALEIPLDRGKAGIRAGESPREGDVYRDILNDTGDRRASEGVIRCTLLPKWGVILRSRESD